MLSHGERGICATVAALRLGLGSWHHGDISRMPTDTGMGRSGFTYPQLLLLPDLDAMRT